MAKMAATESAQRVIDAAVQLFGGRGVMRGEVVERLYREIRALRIYEGATEVQKLIVARELMNDFAKKRARRERDLRAMSATIRPHIDTFARDHLPPRGGMARVHLRAAGASLSGASERRDRAADEGAVERGWGDRAGDPSRPADCAGHTRSSRRRANRIARVLVEDLGLVPGNRVLLRAPNNPMYAACFFGVLKAGGIAVGSMPLLAGEGADRHREQGRRFRTRCAMRGSRPSSTPRGRNVRRS